MPEYDGKTFGAISLLGDEQALRIEALIAAAHAAGASSSGAASSAATPPSSRATSATSSSCRWSTSRRAACCRCSERPSFKQRYNVAASRARDQLWLVHSLDPRRDLQAGDLRRRLIEHVRAAPRYAPAPGAAPGTSPRRPPSALEAEVIERLARWASAPRPSRGGRLPDRHRGLRRPAPRGHRLRGRPLQRPSASPRTWPGRRVLERVGWRFLRLRATQFFRDPDGIMDSVASELRRLGVEPLAPGSEAPRRDAPTSGENLRNKVIRRAWQLMRDQEWVKDAPGEGGAIEELPSDELVSLEEGAVAELVQDETT